MLKKELRRELSGYLSKLDFEIISTGRISSNFRAIAALISWFITASMIY